MKMFVSAYACEPGLGSEIGVGWHWVLELSRQFDLWVLTRESNRARIESWMATHPGHESIHFVYYDLPKWARWWKKGMRGVRIYYNLWQRRTNRLVRETMEREGIKVYHLLTYGNALWPASRYGQQQYFVWGPIGGLDTIPREYTRHYGFRWRMIESVRRMVIKSLPWNSGFQRRCQNADLIFCKSLSMMESIKPLYREKAMLMTDVAVDLSQTQLRPRTRQEDGTIRMLMVGRLDAWRGFDLAIEALSQIADRYPSLRLDILGNGSDCERIVQLVNQFGMQQRVKLHGNVPMETYRQMMADCDIVLNPCLKEGAVTTAFDSLANGRPLVCIETGGYTRYFHDDYAIVIPRGPRKEVIHQLAEAMVRLTDKDFRESLGRRAQEAGRSFSWALKGEEIRQILREHFVES